MIIYWCNYVQSFENIHKFLCHRFGGTKGH